MRLTTKGRYAVTAMLDLALHGTDRPVSLADISGRQAISLSYLEQLFAKLRRNNLVSSVRGPGGGYRLSRGGHEIFVAQIIDTMALQKMGDKVTASIQAIFAPEAQPPAQKREKKDESSASASDTKSGQTRPASPPSRAPFSNTQMTWLGSVAGSHHQLFWRTSRGAPCCGGSGSQHAGSEAGCTGREDCKVGTDDHS